MTNAQNDMRANVCTLTPTPSPNRRGVKKPAFTLAEVLVTLGIIGVVAAMTLPMLAKNYQFYIRQQQFKKAYAALNIATQKAQIDMGEGVRCFYLYGTNDSWNPDNLVDCELFYNELAKNLNLLKTCKGNSLNGGCIPENLRGGDKVYADVQGGDNKSEAEASFNRGCGGFREAKIKTRSTTFVSNSNSLVQTS